MNPTRWDRLELLFDRALPLPAAQRAAFVARETADDVELRAELTALLDASTGAADYVRRLRHELLGSAVPSLLLDRPAAHDGTDPWLGRTVSHYQIVDRMGDGGMGVIYRAHDQRLDRIVALKIIAPELRRAPEARQRFLQEARAAAALDHPNICTIHEIGEVPDGPLFMVMPAYEGETLRQRIERERLPVHAVLDIGQQIARALAAAHECGVVHRDVKPENVFIVRSGVVKLLDFGLAGSSGSRNNEGNRRAGTVEYMSPEQILGQHADERSDVWALGVILYELLAGARPFDERNPQATGRRVLTDNPDLETLRPDLSPQLCRLVQRAMARLPSARFANGAQLLQALQDLPRTEGPTSFSRSGLGRRRTVQRGLRVGAPLLVLVLLSAWLSFRMRASPDTAPVVMAPASISQLLWVDDNPENNTEVVRQLTDQGVRVTTVLNTAEALERYDPTQHQLVVSDMGRYEGVSDAYVGRAGLELLVRLQERRADVRLVFCTSARAAEVYRAEALSAGALDVLDDCARILSLISS